MTLLFVDRYQHLKNRYNERTRAQTGVLTAERLFGQHGFWKPVEGIQNSEKWGDRMSRHGSKCGLHPIELKFGLSHPCEVAALGQSFGRHW